MPKYYAEGSETWAYRAQTTVTRPANTTPYGAGDVLGGAISFTNIGPAGSQLMLTSADLRAHISAVPSGMTTIRLHLYDATPPSATADNAVWDIPAGDRASYLGYIDLGTPTDIGSTLYTQADSVNKHVKLTDAVSTLYGYLVTTGGFTPAGNSEVYVVTLAGIAL